MGYNRLFHYNSFIFSNLYYIHGGGRGIRTPETLLGLAVFKTAAFNHSAIPPSVLSVAAAANCGAEGE